VCRYIYKTVVTRGRDWLAATCGRGGRSERALRGGPQHSAPSPTDSPIPARVSKAGRWPGDSARVWSRGRRLRGQVCAAAVGRAGGRKTPEPFLRHSCEPSGSTSSDACMRLGGVRLQVGCISGADFHVCITYQSDPSSPPVVRSAIAVLTSTALHRASSPPRSSIPSSVQPPTSNLQPSTFDLQPPASSVQTP